MAIGASQHLAAARDVAIGEFVLKPPHGRVDCLLSGDRKAVGVIEAKKEGETLTDVELQSPRAPAAERPWGATAASRPTGIGTAAILYAVVNALPSTTRASRGPTEIGSLHPNGRFL